MTDIVDEHYRRLANRYDDFLCYSPESVRPLTTKMIGILELEPNDILVHLGCGTGTYSRDILEQIPLRAGGIGVGPFQEMLRRIPPETGIWPVHQDALAFSQQPNEFGKVLMKEAIHQAEDRRSLLANLHRRI